jgi:hypothetical protein
MFERIRFVRYALRFEKAFKTDRWDDVRRCFAADAVYDIQGSGSRFDGEARGPDAIVTKLRQMLDEIDRKYDRRAPGLSGWPRMDAGELVVGWKAAYYAGGERTMLHGTSRVRFAGGKIVRIVDLVDAGEWRRWSELVGAAV